MPPLGFVVALFLTTATPPPWGLSWKAPSECIQPAELVQLVEERLGRPVFGANPEFHIDGVLRPYPDTPRWRAKLTLVDRQGMVLGSRDVSSPEDDCRSLNPSLTLVIAVMIDPASSLGPPPPPLPSAPRVEAEAPPETSSEEVGSEPTAPLLQRRSHRATLGLSGGLGPAPAPALGLVGAVEQSVGGRWFFEFRVPVYPYVPVFGAERYGSLLGVGLGIGAGLRGADHHVQTLTWLGSVALEGHGFLATSEGRTEVLGRFDLMARGGLYFPWEELGLSVQLEAGVSPVVPRIRLVTPDGRPDDVGLGFPLRLGLQLALVRPFS